MKHAYVIISGRLFLWCFHGSGICSSTFEGSVSACFVAVLFILLTVSTYFLWRCEISVILGRCYLDEDDIGGGSRIDDARRVMSDAQILLWTLTQGDTFPLLGGP